ncbi:MAG: hypothetical protein RMJ84_09100 [Sandaracinaceae bacterium]|nr:hypothetical protein [Sandaracinaceae bacterium]
MGKKWPKRIVGSALTWTAVLLLWGGCGAKTGLEVGDAEVDGGVDAPSDAGLPCIELPIDGGPIDLPLDTEVQLAKADVFFLLDITASMREEIEQIKQNLRNRIVPGIRQTIPSAYLGVGTFADFPIPPCGEPGDLPFRLVVPITNDVTRVQAALNLIQTTLGRDHPEAQVEALYQVATGEGRPPFVSPAIGCPQGGFGYPCFREDALSIIMLITDAPFHNGPRGTHPYLCSLPVRPATYADALRVLQARGIRVMGLNSGDEESRADLEIIAKDTGAVDNGRPIVFDIGPTGSRLTAGIIDAIRVLARVIELDIDVVLVDPVPGDGVDPTRFVERVIPLRAEPMSGVGSIDLEAGVFRRVRTGTRVVFRLILQGGVVAPGRGPQRFLLEVVFRGDGRQRLGSRMIEIVVPGADGSGC